MDTQRRGRDVGVFLGARSTVAWTMQAMLSAHAANVGGFMASQLANKGAMSTLICWKLGLQGPSLTLQTACSTSLVGVHLAVQSLLNGECGWAVAGGASLLLPQANGHTYQEGMLFSRDGTTRAFDADATGSVFGSGLGAVVLRRAGDALRDGDPIWAIIKGSAVSNDGSRKGGYTAPSAAGQSAAVRTAWQLAELEPHRADYIECHGTATALGDSIEVAAPRDVFGKGNAAPSSCAPTRRSVVTSCSIAASMTITPPSRWPARAAWCAMAPGKSPTNREHVVGRAHPRPVHVNALAAWQ